ncbi:MAG TPA: Na+/H+ antiporter NhaA [Ignavibacteriales bacterium]|nr:Na+/H+ antiporter NhaA [Ignavibacteriales bacterium]
MKSKKLILEFFNSEQSGGFILLFCTILSLFIANSLVSHYYIDFWHSYLDLSFLGLNLKYSLEHWINDGLMVIFFLLVGLEIEREIYVGELSNIKNSLLPIVAAIGGMVVPGLIHFSFNYNTPYSSGFAIPMATDIAFALGILALVGKKAPFSLKIFLTALAIIDDLGAIIIIAIFYTKELFFNNLLISLGIFALLLIFNKLKIRYLSIYLLGGFFMWYFMLKSGVHSTIAGVLLAFAIPFDKNNDENISLKLQHFLHKPVAFIILPVFALANTAIIFPQQIMNSFHNSNSLGIIFGLIFGKSIGIFGFSYLLVKLNFSKLYENMNWKNLFGTSLIAGIGFTMSIFITNLAFIDQGIIISSKLSILVASLIAGISGYLILIFKPKQNI